MASSLTVCEHALNVCVCLRICCHHLAAVQVPARCVQVQRPVDGCRVLGVALPRALAEILLFFFFYSRGRREFTTPLFPLWTDTALTSETWGKGKMQLRGIENVSFSKDLAAKELRFGAYACVCVCAAIVGALIPWQESFDVLLSLRARRAWRIPASGCWKPQAQGSIPPIWH
jgi:hypothetical protein